MAKRAVSIDSTAVSANAVTEVKADSSDRAALFQQLEESLEDQDNSIVEDLLTQIKNNMSSKAD